MVEEERKHTGENPTVVMAGQERPHTDHGWLTAGSNLLGSVGTGKR